jgi:hypothetical protein
MPTSTGGLYTLQIKEQGLIRQKPPLSLNGYSLIKTLRKRCIYKQMPSLVGNAPACYGITLGSNPGISQRYKNGRHKQRSGQNT